MKHQPELLLDARCQVGESLIWHAQERAIYWVDIPAKQLHRYSLESAQHCVWHTPEQLGCIALCANGQLIAGAETGLLQISIQSPDRLLATLLATAPHTAQAMRFNDGRCDRQGRFLAGTMVSNQAVGVGNPSIYQYTATHFKPLLTPLDLQQPFTTPNGMAFSPDGRLFYLSDSHASQQRVWQFDYDVDTGTPYNRREWLNFHHYLGRPDGATVDVDGCYWVCATDAGMVHRFTPDGTLDYSLHLPVKKPTICTWGGTDLSTLYVASIRPAGAVYDQPLAGGIFAFNGLGTHGIAETKCQSPVY
jgi:sugar lactone lactonase YvrE